MKKNRKLIEQANKLLSSELLNFLDLLNNYQIKIYHGNDLSNEYKNFIFNLFEINMKNFYEQLNDNYKSNEKQNELFSNQSRYILILLENSLIAFTHFRFDMDYNFKVLYLYELQIDEKYQGQGIGQWLIKQLKIICQKTQMTKIVLTVQKINRKAIDFYMKKCQFVIDITNPDDNEHADYLILSFTV